MYSLSYFSYFLPLLSLSVPTFSFYIHSTFFLCFITLFLLTILYLLSHPIFSLYFSRNFSSPLSPSISLSQLSPSIFSLFSVTTSSLHFLALLSNSIFLLAILSSLSHSTSLFTFSPPSHLTPLFSIKFTEGEKIDKQMRFQKL